ncbi:siderophore-interacting protein [Schaalia suimastitidis]|uniref:siderophore-interacting protein n=1 Tax=Schaalia suimastitidis TaxID=121163 RepID=UPI000407EC5A|nr:siderophore-interacting protein [Schaalia suimastitidis]
MSATHTANAVQPFDLFAVTLTAIEDLTPHIRRLTFSGKDLEHWADPGWDQRIKLVFPARCGGYAYLPHGPSWYADYLALPEDQRCPIRTYTTRSVTIDQASGMRHVQIDAVRHSPCGPAAQWIEAAQIGDALMLLGPDSRYHGDPGGVDFVPPQHTGAYLLGGDETAAPAIARILEDLPESARGIVVVEMPTQADMAYLPSHPGFDVRVVARDGGEHGQLLVSEVVRAAQELCPTGVPQDVEEINVDEELLWEVPRHAKGGAALRSAPLYAWLAGEASAVKAMRRHLVAQRGLDRRAVAFMGYWRRGRAES